MAARRTAHALALALLGLTAAAVLASPASVNAATPWAVDLSPPTLTKGVATDVTVTVTSGDLDIGRVVLTVPAGFTVVRTSISSVPAGSVWTSAGAGPGPVQVTFGTTKDFWRLARGARAIFIVRVIATASPLGAWTASAYHNSAVNSQRINGPLRPPGPFVITLASTPAPTRPPTPAPTARPTGPPTPRPTTAPTVFRTATNPSPSNAASPSDTPSALGSGLIAGGGAAATSAEPGGAIVSGGGGTALNVQVLPAGGTVQLDIQAVGAIGMFAWLVPGLALSLPGMLLILIVLAQAGVGAAFVPVTRRAFGVTRRRRGPDRPTSP